MNPHPASSASRNPAFPNPDARIDHVLEALRSTQPTPGLEARIAAHLLANGDARRLALNTAAASEPTSFFAIMSRRTAPLFAVVLNAVKDPSIFSAEARPYAFAATTLTLLLTFSVALHLYHNPQTLAQWNPIHAPNSAPTQTASIIEPSSHATTAQAAPNPIPSTYFEGAELQSRHQPQPTNTALAAEAPGIPPQPTDPDTIALAETLAPSHPAPPMPLTAQEALLVRATRQGQPIELAELGIARESNLRSIADARDHSSLRQYIKSLLAPLAAAQAFESTPSPSPDAAPPAPASETTSPPLSK
jgi:hypothetical protein